MRIIFLKVNTFKKKSNNEGRTYKVTEEDFFKFDFSLAVDYFCGSIYLRPPRKKISEEAAPSPSLSLSLVSSFSSVRLSLKLEETERHPFYRLLLFGLAKEVKS